MRAHVTSRDREGVVFSVSNRSLTARLVNQHAPVQCTKMHQNAPLWRIISTRKRNVRGCPKMSDRGETSHRSVGQNEATANVLPSKNPLDIRQGLSRMKAVTFTCRERVELRGISRSFTLSRPFRRREMRTQLVSKSGRIYSAVG